eukprot:CCRYP_000587-RA/>CCRYP_000587-RA protein AED:0.06 eAED:0.06 QI:295/0.5/0.66/1/1/1/3/2692/665
MSDDRCRLIPALNVISDYYKIPDDIAGLGTIVGSEIFNLLIISAGSVYASEVRSVPHEKYGHRYLVLDKVMVVREVVFYGLSIGLLYLALSTTEVVLVQDQENGGEEVEEDRIFVSFWKACLVFGVYILYVLICANMPKILWFSRTVYLRLGLDRQVHIDEVDTKVESAEGRGVGVAENLGTSIHYKSFDDQELHQLPYIYNIKTEPNEHPEIGSHSTDDVAIHVGIGTSIDKAMAKDDNHLHTMLRTDPKEQNILSKAILKSFKLIKPNHLLCRDEYPAEINEVFELKNSSGGTNEIGCFLWQRSIFYNKAYFGSHAFHLRWFTITPQRIASSLDRLQPTKHQIIYPLFDEIHVDVNRLIINIVHPVRGKRDFTLMAPSKAIFEAVLHSFQVYIETNQDLRSHGVLEIEESDEISPVILSKARDNDADEHVTLIERPANATVVETILWASLLPLRYVMHYTLPDVRHLDRHGDPTKSIGYAYLSTIMCLVWLIVGKASIEHNILSLDPLFYLIARLFDAPYCTKSGSYAMVSSLESLAELIGISNAIMGVTLSAAGTSLPAYIASRIAAEKGFGNLAIANVLGSNTFNIAIGLGLPWAMYIAATGFEPYHDLMNEGIEESMIILAGTLILFVALLISTSFTLLKWHADLFIVLYVLYILYSVWP